MRIFNKSSLKEAAKAINKGQLVAFPTETVYGLGARADQSEAVSNIFTVKGRPQDNPLIVHVASIADVEQYVEEVTPVQRQLMEAFWPGPLTLIFPLKAGVFAEEVSGGKQTVAMRMPKQPLTLQLIREVGFPLVGPSANKSGKPSPTSVAHVLHDFEGEIAGVLAGEEGMTEIGLESTVLYAEDDALTILRPGIITASELKQVVNLPIRELSAEEQLETSDVMSPGVKYRHYSPKQPVVMIQAHHNLQAWREIIGHFTEKVGILAENEIVEALKNDKNIFSSFTLGKTQDTASFNRYLYAGLRYLEASGCELILVQALPDTEMSQAYMNRLKKASSYIL